MNPDLTILAKAVAHMRSLQKQYFEARAKQLHSAASQILPHAKDAEAKVDRMLKQISEPTNQNTLFP